MHKITLLFLSVLFFAGCITNVDEQVVQKQAEISTNGVNSISLEAGSYHDLIQIFGDTNKSILAEASMRLWASDRSQADNILSNVELRWQVNSGVASLITDYPSSRKELVTLESPTIYTNENIALELQTGSNDLTVIGMNSLVNVTSTAGRIDIKTEGRITLRSGSGSIQGFSGLGGSIETDGGEIDFDLTNVNFEGLVIKQTTGNTYIRIPRFAHVTFLLEAEEGAPVSLDYDGVHASYNDASSHTISVNGGGKAISITSTTGSITVRDH